jgi:hypothetical protein
MNATRLAVLGLLVVGVAAGAQRPTRPMSQRGQAGAPDQRRELEDEVRRGFARAVRERVGLTDDQMAKLGPTTRKYEEQRRQTQMDERDARQKLQAIVLVGTDADSSRIKGFIAQLMDVRRRRLQIDEAEQKELATIMTPMQQAKFLGLREQVQRRLEQARPFPGGPPEGDGFGPGRPERRPEAGPDSVFVRFNVQPFNAAIFVDDLERGAGRTRLKVPVGTRRLMFSAPGCKTVEQVFDAKPGPEAIVSRVLSCP